MTTTSGTGQQDTRRQLRGSGLLLFGRLGSKVINFGVQVAIVRILTKDDFGAFAYGLAIVAAGELLVKIGLGQGANRFIPYHFERREYPEMLGILSAVTVMIMVLGLLGWLALVWLSYAEVSGFPSAGGALVVLIIAFLAPLQAFDSIMVQTLACFSKARQIVIRKHVIGPGLRVAAVVCAFAAGGSPEVLAAAYLFGGVVGVVLCTTLVVKQLYVHEILPMAPSMWRVPWAPLLRYSIPLISNDVVFITLTGVTTVLLMSTGGEAAVAAIRSVAPAAALNMLVAQSFVILFLPSATRLFAREDKAGLSHHHWESVAWVAVLSFPLFVLTFAVAPALVPLLFGTAYADSAVILAVLALGSFASVLMAFNSEFLQVVHKTQPLVWSNILVIVTSIVLALWLCPPLGALGAAIAVTVARILGVSVRQIFLLQCDAIGPVPYTLKLIWIRLTILSIITGLVGWVWQPDILLQLFIVGIACFWLLRACARTLNIANTFPEVLRIPWLAKLISA
ncbi:MAG: oligosaccharide flippase family protein [bacterium]